ncbi:MAG TPA: cyclic peptide export ABC transporter [Pyrinomonadaceae bacterium]|jgi:putative ATP-binding cassette transporter|nr:cyclic peptide export ABC transporter [Pyrinomonadaceae bacterium]
MLKLLSFILKCSGTIRYSRPTLVFILAAGVVSGVGSTALIAIINKVLSDGGQATPGTVWAFIGLCACVPVARFASQTLLEGLTSKATLRLRLQLCRRILSSPLRLLEELGPHRLLAALTDDVTSITGALSAIPTLCMNVAIVACCLVYLGLLSLPMLLCVFVFMVLALVSYQAMLLKATRHLRRGRDLWETMLNHFRSLSEGTKELKLHSRRRRDFFTHLLDPTAVSLRKFYVTGSSLYAAAGSWGQILFFALVGLLIFTTPGGKGVSGPTLASFTLTLLYMVGPLDAIMQTVIGLNRSGIALQKVEELGLSLLSSPAEKEAEQLSDRPPAWKTIELDGVTHAYRSEDHSDFTLGPINLTLNAGETVFVVGGNGSGKTSLLKLLTGLYAPEAGAIRLDGRTVDDETREQYRQFFTVVFSDFYLFENLLGLDTLELDEKARRYLERLRLDQKVRVKDGLLSTLDLSQGQRKRLALLTAYLEDRHIYVFDEWAADQDPRFKDIFYLEILPELKARGKTLFVISHDDRYYQTADRILKLENGQVELDDYCGHAPALPFHAALPLGDGRYSNQPA